MPEDAVSPVMPRSHIEEQLSIAYVRAVAARAGVKIKFTDSPEYGTDVYLQRITHLPTGEITETGWMILCQLKATTSCKFQADSIAYDMKIDAYNKLAAWEGPTPCILVLLRLPDDFDEWLNLDEERLLLKNCCYWTRITEPVSTNVSSKRIFIPRTQLFTPEAVTELFDLVGRGEF
jgi:hypothetical protein